MPTTVPIFACSESSATADRRASAPETDRSGELDSDIVQLNHAVSHACNPFLPSIPSPYATSDNVRYVSFLGSFAA
jgi:hypothetical protein